MTKLPTSEYADLLMCCGALHEIAEILQMQTEVNPFLTGRLYPQVNLISHVKTIQRKLEKIAADTCATPGQ